MMSNYLVRVVLFSLLAWSAMIAPATAADRAAVKYRFKLPPSADLVYSIKAKQSGLAINGDALIQWNAANNKFSVTTETRAMLVGKILDAKSEGAIDEFGLAPATFTEKRFRKEPTTASFNRQTKTISFTQSAQTYPIKGGEQDRNSAIWQLIAVARGNQAKFKPGSAWFFFVAGQRDAEQWTFKVTAHEKIGTPLGDIDALHIERMAPPDSKGQHLDIWLAPSMEWYPVRLRYTDSDTEFIEQTLQKITKK
jgi:hypothetical protein